MLLFLLLMLLLLLQCFRTQKSLYARACKCACVVSGTNAHSHIFSRAVKLKRADCVDVGRHPRTMDMHLSVCVCVMRAHVKFSHARMCVCNVKTTVKSQLMQMSTFVHVSCKNRTFRRARARAL